MSFNIYLVMDCNLLYSNESNPSQDLSNLIESPYLPIGQRWKQPDQDLIQVRGRFCLWNTIHQIIVFQIFRAYTVRIYWQLAKLSDLSSQSQWMHLWELTTSTHIHCEWRLSLNNRCLWKVFPVHICLCLGQSQPPDYFAPFCILSLWQIII